MRCRQGGRLLPFACLREKRRRHATRFACFGIVSAPGPLWLFVPAAGGKAVRLTEEGSDMTPDWKK